MIANTLTLSVFAETRLGSKIYVAGSIEHLGNWSPMCGPALTTDPTTYPKWSVTLNTNGWPPDGIEYKFVIIESEGKQVWEDGSNRSLSLESPSSLLQTPWFGELDCRPSPPCKPITSKAAAADAANACDGRKNGGKPSGTAQEAGDRLEMTRVRSEPAPENDKLEVTKVRNFRHKRCASVPHLSGILEQSTCIEQVPPRNPEDCFPACSSARERAISPTTGPVDNGCINWARSDTAMQTPESVEVVFETNGSKFQLKKDRGDEWSLSFDDTGLAPNVYMFFFLVNGQRTLSRRHNVHCGRNVALFSGKLSKYVENQAAKRCAASDELGSKERERASSFTGQTPKATGFARPHSISHNLASLAGAGASSDEEEEPGNSLITKSSLHTTRNELFPEEIFEGLYDSSLRLRLHGFVLPAADSLTASEAPLRLRFKPGAARLGKPSGLECEDAYFANEFSLGVADGVGSMVQFARFGVNSAAYAQDLMEIAEASLSSNPSNDSVKQRALDACRAAEDKSSQYGASTISVMALEGSTIGCANLGDSGFLVLRKGSAGMCIVQKSVDQQHSWNCPYQLTRLPPLLAAKFANFPQDHATDSDSYSYEVEEGDLVLLFSDGVKDNLHSHEIISIVDRSLSPAFAGLVGLPCHATEPYDIAQALAQAALIRSKDPRARVPFTLYSLEHGYDCLGGKEDDITVVAAWLVPDTEVDVAMDGFE